MIELTRIKSKLIITLLTLFIAINGQSQSDYDLNSYRVSSPDLTMDVFEKDSLANALVLYEFGKSYIDDTNFDLTFEFNQKLKILNRNGFDKANITVYLYNNEDDKEIVQDIIATTYNIENGEITSTKLDKNNIYKEKYNDNYTLVKFSMPNVKPGSVITYSYKIKSPFIYKYKSWRFQDDIPKLYSEYQTSIPAVYEYNIKLVGSLKLDKNEQVIKRHCVVNGVGGYADCTVTIYVMKNIPAFINESFMTTRDNYLSRIEYELKTVKGFDGSRKNITRTWRSADKELKVDESIGRQMKKNGLVKGLLNTKITSEINELIKSKSIFKFIQNNYTWNEKFNTFNNVSVKDLIKTKTGNVSEINLLLYNILSEQGINVTPVLLSTRSNGLPTKIYPVISDFNYIILQANINGEKYFLDATDKYLSFGQIPFRCLNQYGRLLDFKNGSEWVPIKVKTSSIKQYNVSLSINESQETVGNVKYKTTGYHALPIKSSFFRNPSEHFKSYQDKFPEIEILNYKTNYDDKNSALFEEMFDVKLSNQLVGDNLYINPFLFVFFESNPFKLEERTYPIDFGYKDAYLYSLKFKIDKGYEVVDFPKEKLYKLPNNKGTVVLKSLKKNNTVSIYFKFDFKDAIYDSSYYPYLKEYMSTVIDVQSNSLIVLKKKAR
jgi:hypothetical protein